MQELNTEFWRNKRVVALSGGIGGARLVHGLYQLLPGENLDVIINTGDDFEHLAVFVSPDCDTVMYTLAELSPADRGWGVVNDSDQAMRMVQSLGEPTWFNLGDRDLGTNLLRTDRLRRGHTLTSITRDFARSLGVRCQLLPMADSPHPTRVHTQDGRNLSFQQWLVGERGAPTPKHIELQGDHKPTPQVLDAIDRADLIVIPPSNPWVSVEPILALDGVRERVARKPVVGVSPIIRGAAVKGPLAAMIPALMNTDAAASAVAERYSDLLSIWVVAHGDRDTGSPTSFETIERDILMGDLDGRRRLAAEVLAASERLLR